MRKLLFKALKISGLPVLFREWVQQNKVTILVFHDINEATAEQTFAYLSKHYNIINLNRFITACEKKDASLIPQKALIITFDDGHIKNYELLPVFKKYSVPATIFLCAAIVNTKRNYWFKFDHEAISLRQLKRELNKNRLKILADFGFEPQMEFETAQALTKQQIGEMKSYLNLQGHTMFHPCLPKCTDIEARTEIFKSKEILERDFYLAINAIAYPNGDYSDREIALSKEAGYKCGLTVDFGFNTINSDLFKLKRIDTNDTADMNELIVKSSGLWSFLKTRLGFKNEINKG